MKHLSPYLLSLILLVFAWNACIDPVEFEPEEAEQFVVINGIIHNQAGPYTVSIRKSATSQQEEEALSGAEVYILDGNENRFDLGEVSPGIYETDSSQMLGRVGERYQLKIQLREGGSYESDIEELQAPLPIGKLSFQYKEEEELNELSNIVLEKKLRISVENTVPGNRRDLYFKWETYGEWEFRETDALSDIFATSGAGPEMFTCFLRDDLKRGDLHLYDASRLSTPSFQQEIKTIPVNYKFAFNYCVHVRQLVINQKAYEFWEQLKKLSERNGLFLESLPGTVKGNIKNSANPDEQVFGYFYAASISTDRIFVSPDEVSKPLSKCFNIDPAFTQACDECLLLDGAFRGAPDYWP